MIWRIFNFSESKAHLHNIQNFGFCLTENTMRLDYTDLQFKDV